MHPWSLEIQKLQTIYLHSPPVTIYDTLLPQPRTEQGRTLLSDPAYSVMAGWPSYFITSDGVSIPDYP
jgi:hypothetical protein